ncbi:MAG: aminotransferase class IV [Verrucomicrobia bacterium]|nr:aminotransferase class IV [Verrucomicrobiota bacterium]
MQVFLNGQFVPEDQAYVSVFDRGFLYGDALFETLRVYGGRPFRWRQHLERLQRGADYLRLRLPFAPDALRGFADELLRRNAVSETVLRLTLTRGVGPRGYSPRRADRPFLVMELWPAPPVEAEAADGWRVIVSSIRVPADDPLAAFKTANKLPQVLARAEADAQGADEALLLNHAGNVTEATASNLFWIQQGTVLTPPLSSGVLPGVTRALVLELCAALGIPCAEADVKAEGLKAAEGAFLSRSTSEIVEVVALDGVAIKRSGVVPRLRRAYRDVVRFETTG